VRSLPAGGDLPLLQDMTDNLEVRRRVMEEARALVRTILEFPLPIVPQ